MNLSHHVVFLLDLVQDVAVSRPIAAFAARETHCALSFVVTEAFRRRDPNGLWIAEVEEICRDLHAEIISVVDVADVVVYLGRKSGILFAGSESNLPAHQLCNEVFLAAPASFLRVTLQHGLECIGFNHNDAHDRMWGHYIGMGCDVAAGWFEDDRLHSVRPDQRSKIMIVGPPLGLDHAPVVTRSKRRSGAGVYGLVCENMHSVRFAGAGVIASFTDTFAKFAKKLAEIDGAVELRPHPAGRYTEKKNIPLPANVRLNRMPLYKQALSKFAFCISAPSSVLLDMIWAGVPTAVWTTSSRSLDIGIYDGLTVVHDEQEWFDFAMDAARDPTPFLEAQARYLASLNLPADIPARYRELIHLV